jgi:hypothetical protein
VGLRKDVLGREVREREKKRYTGGYEEKGEAALDGERHRADIMTSSGAYRPEKGNGSRE